MNRILLTHSPHARQWYGDEALRRLTSLGEIVMQEEEREWSMSELSKAAMSCDVIVSDRATPAPASLFAESDRLVAIVRCAMDVRNIDISAASASGVLVTHAGPGFVESVAEWIIAQMINLARSIPRYIMDYKKGTHPAPIMGTQLSGKVAGIIGFGNIGRYLAPALQAIGMQVIIYDPWADVPSDICKATDYFNLLEKADAVICLAAYTEETENLIDQRALDCMKDGALFINASRGGLVDEDALERALDSERLAGAALDVGRDHDNLPSLRLAQRSDVIATPHIGGLVPEAIEYQALQTVDQVSKILSGSIPDGALNPEAATRLRLRAP